MSEYPVTKKRLGEILIEEGSISSEQLEKALERQSAEKKRLGRILVDMNLLTQLDITVALSKQLNIPIFDIEGLGEFDKEAIALIPRDLAVRDIVLPLSFEEKDITVVISDPLDLEAIKDVEFASGRKVKLTLAPEGKLLEAIERAYETGESIDKVIDKFIPDTAVEIVPEATGDELDESRLVESSDAPPVIRLVSLLISDGASLRASDIHLEPKEKRTTVRYRIDGEMRKIMTIPSHLHQSVISRIKIMSNMDISERRKPQDGGTKVRVGGRIIDLRISTLPSLYGERLVMRILDPSKALVSLDRLGIDPSGMRLFNTLINYPQGVLLITGPTGSGKTTLLYSAMNEMRTEEVTLITLEDPVEYKIEGINQVQVNEKVGMTFASGLRSILRQDPDVVMVGEIRDQETAEIAFRAAQTGHLVLSTLHTNDAVSTVTRLYDIGLPPYLIASGLIGIVAQRLIRRICDFCRQLVIPDLSRIDSADFPKVEKFYRGAGCQKCNYTGYLGRIGVFEIVPFDAELRTLIDGKADESKLSSVLKEKGVVRMFDAAWVKLQMGLTTLDEIIAKVPHPPEISLKFTETELVHIDQRSTESSQPHILILDTDPEEGSELVTIFRKENYQCTLTPGLDDSLRMLHRETIDLLFLATRQGEESTFSILDEMRKKLWTSYIPVIVIADPDDFTARKQAVSLGIQHIVSRPLDTASVKEKVGQLIGNG